MSLFALPRIGRAGLGNGLLPWARAELFGRRLSVPVLAPRWGRLRLGPHLRQEPEKRHYGGLFRSAEHVRGISGAAIRIFGTRLEEGRPDHAYAKAKHTSWPFVVGFEGMGELFAPLLGEHEFIRAKLWQMTRSALRPASNRAATPFIAMHVRRGDITRQGFSEEQLVDVRQFTPLSWFVAMVHAMRRVDGARDRTVVVFSDGSPDELADLLALDGVRLHMRRSAITDLWLMSTATALFGSGFSTFGMWASYLGGMPTFYAPGKLQQRVQAGRSRAVELEIAPGDGLPGYAFYNAGMDRHE